MDLTDNHTEYFPGKRYSETELKQTKRRSGTSGELGVRFEKKILLLGLYRAIKEKYDFTLDTNVDWAGAFDDVVFTCKETDGFKQRIYLQAKHKENENTKITFKELLYSYGDYSLYKYFIDYIENSDKDEIEKKYFVIYTNADFMCPGPDDNGLRIHRSSKGEYFIFRKIDAFENRLLGIFANLDYENENQSLPFYQFSDVNNNNDAGELNRVIGIMAKEFRTTDEKKKRKLTNLSEKELTLKLKGYLNALVFAVNQHDEKFLGNLIKEEMKNDYPHYNKKQVDFAFEYALNQITQWKDKNSVPLTEINNYFTQSEERFETFRALFPVIVFENELSDVGIRFVGRLYCDLHNFILSKKQLWVISTETPWLNSLVIYRALKEETLIEKTGIDYANFDHHFHVTTSDFLKAYNCILSTFKELDQSIMIISYEPNDEVDSKSLVVDRIVNEIVRIVSESKSTKQVILIVPKNHKLSESLKQKMPSSYNKAHGKIEFVHLTKKSQEMCLSAEKIRFQGKEELINVQKLLKLEFPVTEETIAKLNLDTLGLERLLKCSIVEIGNKQPHLSHLESAYYKAVKHVEVDQIQHALEANPEDIFAFVGEEEDVKYFLPSKRQNALVQFEARSSPVNGGVFLLEAGNEEQQFEQLCNKVDEDCVKREIEYNEEQPALHLLKKETRGWVWTRTYSRDFYIRRQLHRVLIECNKIKEIFFNNSYSFDFIIFSGIDEEALLQLLDIKDSRQRENFRKNSAIFQEESDARSEFERKKNERTQSRESIHWLKVIKIKNEVELEWYISEGEINQLSSIIKKESVEETRLKSISENILINSKARFIVLEGDPGMGKSMTFVHVTELMKKKNPFLWLINVDLNRHQSVLASNNVDKIEHLVNLLSRIEENVGNSLTRCFLSYQLTIPGRVLLLWDAFDEVKSDRQNVLLELLLFLKSETKANVWVTTRGHDRTKLEKNLSVFAYTLQPLDKTNLSNFLKRFWTTTLKFAMLDVTYLESYAREIIQAFDHHIHGNYQSDQSFQMLLATIRYQQTIAKPEGKSGSLFEIYRDIFNPLFDTYGKGHQMTGSVISIPLQTRMMVEIYEQDVKNALKEHVSPSDFSKTVNLGLNDLYQQFVLKKFDIYWQEKAIVGEGLDEESKNVLMESWMMDYGRLAVTELFDKQETKDFIGDKIYSLNTLFRIGFIKGNTEPPDFIHRTFAEYFAAKYLVKCVPMCKKFLSFQLFRKEFKQVRRFIDHFVTQNLLLHRSVLENDLLKFNKLREHFDVGRIDNLGRTVLHLAAQEDRSEILEYLMKVSDDIFVRDCLGKTPLHYAAGFGHTNVVGRLLENHIDIDLNDHIFRNPLNSDVDIGNSIFNNLDYRKSKLIKLVNERDETVKSPFYYAAENEYWDTACCLLLYGADSEMLEREQKEKLLCFAWDQRPIICFPEHPLGNIFRFLLSKVPGFSFSRLLIYDYVYKALLKHFLDRCHYKLIDVLLKDINNEQIITDCPIQCISPLPHDCPIQTKDNKLNFSDEDYLKILKHYDKRNAQLKINAEAKESERYLSESARLGFYKTFKYLFDNRMRRKDASYVDIVYYKPLLRDLLSNITYSSDTYEGLQCLMPVYYEAFRWTRLHLAAKIKNVKSFESFFDPPPAYETIIAKDERGLTALHYASSIIGKSGFIERLFVELKKNKLHDRNKLYEIINCKCNYGQTPLHICVKTLNYESTEVLLKNVKDIEFSQEQLFNIINSRDEMNLNPLERTVVFGSSTTKHTEFLAYYLDQIKIFKLSSRQWIDILKGSSCLLEKLIMYFDKEALILLNVMEDLPLDDNQKAEIVNVNSGYLGNTPLHDAVMVGRCCEVVVSLLKNGAVYNAYNSSQKVPLDMIKQNVYFKDMPRSMIFDVQVHEKIIFLLTSIDKLFELCMDEKILDDIKKMKELEKILSELKIETWFDPISILKARNREGKTLLNLSKHAEVTNLLQYR